MTVLGFSHIVTEIRDFEKSISYYEKLGYSVEYEISQVVPDEKRSVLNQNPSEVHLYYLRHKKSPRIGIELIKHNESSEGKRAKNIAHGWSFADSQVSLAKDPDENALIEFPYLGKGPKQHLFIPTSKFQESLDFYTNVFSLKLLKGSGDFGHNYKELYQNFGQFAVLTLRSCLSPNWNLALHLVETEKEQEEIHLNETGFSCFCLLINQAEFARFQEMDLDMIGPLVGEKKVKEKVAQFRFGFIRDPNHYLVEYYLS